MPARGIVHRRQVHGDPAQFAVEQASTGDPAADFAAVDQHVRLNAGGHRPVGQEGQGHIPALEAHLEGAVLLPLRVDFNRPPVEETALVQLPATERLGQPFTERVGQPFHGNVVRRPRRVAVVQVGEQAQLRHRQAVAALQPEHGDAPGVGVGGHQGAGLHRPAAGVAEPAQHAVETGAQGVIVEPGHGELQRVAVDARHAVAGAAGHPAVQAAGAGHPVQGVGGEAGETGLDGVHPAFHAGQIELLQHPPGLMLAQPVADRAQPLGQHERPLRQLPAERVDRQVLALETPVRAAFGDPPTERHRPRRHRAGRRLATQRGHRQLAVAVGAPAQLGVQIDIGERPRLVAVGKGDGRRAQAHLGGAHLPPGNGGPGAHPAVQPGQIQRPVPRFGQPFVQALAVDVQIAARIELVQAQRVAVHAQAGVHRERPVAGFHPHRHRMAVTAVVHGQGQGGRRQRRQARPVQREARVFHQNALLPVERAQAVGRVALLPVLQRFQAAQADAAVLAPDQVHVHALDAQFPQVEVAVEQSGQNRHAGGHLVQAQRRLPFRVRQGQAAHFEARSQAVHAAVQLLDHDGEAEMLLKHRFQLLAVIGHQQHQLARHHHVGRQQQHRNRHQPP